MKSVSARVDESEPSATVRPEDGPGGRHGTSRVQGRESMGSPLAKGDLGGCPLGSPKGDLGGPKSRGGYNSW